MTKAGTQFWEYFPVAKLLLLGTAGPQEPMAGPNYPPPPGPTPPSPLCENLNQFKFHKIQGIRRVFRVDLAAEAR